MGLSPAGDARARGRSRQSASTSGYDALRRLIAPIAPDDASTLSHQLIDRYGSLAGVFDAVGRVAEGTEDLPDGVCGHLRDLSDALTDVRNIEAQEGLAIGSPAALGRLLFHDMAQLPRETFRVLFLDGMNRILDDRTMWTGTVDRVQVHPREVVAAAIETGATALVLAHNHPTTSSAPTAADIAQTRRVVDACATIDVVVHDHIVVAQNGLFSMRAAGMLDVRVESVS